MLVRRIIDLILPRGCAGCDKPDAVMCAACRQLLGHCLARSLPGLTVYAAGRYRSQLRRAILAWKDHDDIELDKTFGDALAVLVMQLMNDGVLDLPEPVLVMPVPSSPSSMRRRGRWHTVPLARSVTAALCARGIHAEISKALISHARGGRSVEQRSSSQREQRIQGRITVSPKAHVSGGTVILVDDIVTTGATIRQCAMSLRDRGALVPVAIALASSGGDPRDDADHGDTRDEA